MTSKTKPSTRSHALHPAWWFGVCAVYALCMNLSRLHRVDDGDSVIPALVSTLHWTPFYWHNNRYGMLVPLLAVPIRDPWLNYLFVYYVAIIGGLATFFLTARFLFGRVAWWPLLAAIAITLSMLSGSTYYLSWTFGTAQFWSTPLAMVLVAMLLMEGPTVMRSVSALVLVTLAGWYNLTVPMLGGMLYAGRTIAQWDVPKGGLKAFIMRHGPITVLLCWGAVFGQWLAKSSIYNDVHITDLVADTSVWWRNVHGLWDNSLTRFGEDFQGRPFALFVIVACLALAPLTIWRTGKPPLWRTALAGVLTALFYGAVAATQTWVTNSSFQCRFWLPTWVLLFFSAVSLAVGPLLAAASPQRLRQITVGTAVAAFLVLIAHFGLPSTENAQAGWLDQHRPMASAAANLGYTHIAGSYHRAWPAVLAASMELYNTDASRKIYGISDRYEDSRGEWPTDMTAWRIAVAKGDEQFLMRFMASAGVRQLSRVADQGTFLVVTPMLGSAAPATAEGE